MIGFLKRFNQKYSKKNVSVSCSKKTESPDSKYRAGDIYSFKTSPLNGFGDQDTGRYACLKILMPVECLGKLKADLIGFVVLDKIFDHPPLLAEVKKAVPLEFQRFGRSEKKNSGKNALSIAKKYALSSTNRKWKNDLLEFSLIGNMKLSASEETMRKDLRNFSAWAIASNYAETEWRWKYDKDNLVSEIEKIKIFAAKHGQITEEQVNSRLSTLTWEQVETEVYFKRWNESPPFPSKEFTEEMRRLVKHSIADLRALGMKPSRPKVRKILKQLVADITKLNEKHDTPIETEERDDIYEVFYDLTHLTKQKTLMDEIGDWHYSKW